MNKWTVQSFSLLEELKSLAVEQQFLVPLADCLVALAVASDFEEVVLILGQMLC